MGWSQKVSLIKWHFEQSTEGNEGASYVNIWEMSIPGEGTEFGAVLKYTVAKRALLFSLSPFLPFSFLKLCGNSDYFKWDECRDTFKTSSELLERFLSSKAVLEEFISFQT